MLCLPSDILSHIYSEWLDIESVARLDSATTCRSDREKLMSELRSPSCVLRGHSKADGPFWNERANSLAVYEWLLLRGYNSRELRLADDWWRAEDEPQLLSDSQLELIESIDLQVEVPEDDEDDDDGESEESEDLYRHFRVLITTLQKCTRLTCIKWDLGENIETLLPQILSALPNALRKLVVSFSRIRTSFPNLSERVADLEALELINCDVDDIRHRNSKGCHFKRLKAFKIEGGECGDELGWLLQSGTPLESLSLSCQTLSGVMPEVGGATMKQLDITARLSMASESANSLTALVHKCAALRDVRLSFDFPAMGTVVDALPATLRTVHCSTLGSGPEEPFVRLASRNRQLEVLTLGGFQFTNAILEAVASSCPLLRELRLFNGNLLGTAWVFQACPRLVIASLLPMKLRDYNVPAIVTATPRLSELDIDGSLLTEDGIRGLCGLTRLQKMTVRGHRPNERHWNKLREANPAMVLTLV